MDRDFRDGCVTFVVVVFLIVGSIWSYEMFGPSTDTTVAINHGYVQKVVPTADTGTTTIWTKP